MKTKAIILLTVLTLIGCRKSPSDIKLPSLIGDNMVLQQKSGTMIWGTAAPGHKIDVTASWNAKLRATSAKDGKWSVILPVPEAGGPFTITISGRDTSILIKNVLSGEVWFCAGQSNMEITVAGLPGKNTVMHSAETIAASEIPEIRLFNVQKNISVKPIDDCNGKWEVSSPSSVKTFSAAAYFFGMKLYNELKVPIGLIESVWGGTPSESWTSSESLQNAGEFITELAAIKDATSSAGEFQSWLNGHKQMDVKPAGDSRWKDLNFGDEKAASPDFDDSRWPAMALPRKFESVMGEFDGAIWFRRKVEIPGNMTRKDLVLSLGPIDDMDRTYFNGQLVGTSEADGLWDVDRHYKVPAALVKEGINTIAVRVLDTGGAGGIWGEPGKMKLSLKDNPASYLLIEGEWKYKPVAELWDPGYPPSGSKFYIYDLASNVSKTRPKRLGPMSPSALFNAMVHPVLPYRIKGAIWYQGETNVGRADQYRKIFPLMIRNWREAWKIEDFPFYFVQIAPYVYSNVDSSELALLREAQSKALELPKTGMIVTLDIGTVMNIHPPFKKEIGERLANLALSNDYGKSIPCSGPAFKSMVRDGRILKLQFDNTGTGLKAKDNSLSEFEIAGKDLKFVKASAKIVKNEVWVESMKVTDPVSVRYCWRNGAVASLFNSDGLPASQFMSNIN
jgi:sialate O-acetylesterase